MARLVGPLVRAASVVGIGLSIALSGCTPTLNSGDTATGPERSTEAAPDSPSLVTPPSLMPSAGPTVVASPPLPMPIPSAPSSTGAARTTPSPTTAASADPAISRIGERQWARIEGTATWRPECPVGREDLRRLDVNYVDFDGVIRRGNLIAHRDSVEDLASVFSELFDAGFPVERMESVEEYSGDVVRSLEANNTSAFNCRRPDQINAPVMDSPHANGRAIDINPYQNPWTDPRCNCWVPSAEFADDRSGAGVITKGSLPWRLFTERGWIWQNIKVPDYMHFDTGFPSRPR